MCWQNLWIRFTEVTFIWMNFCSLSDSLVKETLHETEHSSNWLFLLSLPCRQHRGGVQPKLWVHRSEEADGGAAEPLPADGGAHHLPYLHRWPNQTGLPVRTWLLPRLQHSSYCVPHLPAGYPGEDSDLCLRKHLLPFPFPPPLHPFCLHYRWKALLGLVSSKASVKEGEKMTWVKVEGRERPPLQHPKGEEQCWRAATSPCAACPLERHKVTNAELSEGRRGFQTRDFHVQMFAEASCSSDCMVSAALQCQICSLAML